MFFWYPKENADLKMIHDENNVLTDYQLVIVRDSLKTQKRTYLCKDERSTRTSYKKS